MRKGWRILFVLIFLEIFVDGFFVYCFFFYTGMHFIKDFVLALTFLFFLLQEPFQEWFNRLGKELGAGAVFCMFALITTGILSIFNAETPSLIRGLLGLKLQFLPWLIIPLCYAYFDNVQVIEKFFKILVWSSVPINILGLMQYAFGPGFMVGTFGPGFINNTQIAMIGGDYSGKTFVRIVGTFAASSLYGEFLVFTIIICFAFFSSRTKARWPWILAIAQNFVCLLGTGSRGALLCLICMFLIFSKMLKRARSMAVGFLLFGVVLYVAFAVLGSPVSARFKDAMSVKIIRERTIDTTHKMFFRFLERYPFGKGIGSASQASRYLGKLEGEYELVENYPSKLLHEIGIVGVIFFYILIILLIARWFYWASAFKEENQAFLFFIALSAYFIGSLIAGTFPDTPPASILFWACLGILPRISQIESVARKKLINDEITA